MKRSAIVMMFSLFVPVSLIPLFYTGCGVSNPNEPNWGYPTATVPTSTFTPGGPTNTPTISYTPTITTTVYPTSTNTFSPTPTVPGFLFNTSGNVASWGNSTNSQAPVGLVFNSSFGGCTTVTGAMEITIGFTGVNQGIFVQDDLSTPLNLSGKTITAILEVNAGWNSDSEQVYGAIFVQQGNTAGSGTAWSSLYQGGTGLFNASTSTVSSSGCVTLTLALPSSTTNTNTASYSIFGGPIDPTVIGRVGIQLGSGSSGNTFSPTVVDVQSWIYQ